MSNNDNDGNIQAGPSATPGYRRPTASSSRGRSNRDISRQARTPGPKGSNNDDSRPMVHVPTVGLSTTDEQVPQDQVHQDQVPPHGFTKVVSDGTRHRHNRRTATVSRVVAIPPGGTSPPTGPTDDNRLLPVRDLFDDDDNPHQPNINPIDTVNQPDANPIDNANPIDTILRAINKRFDNIIAKLDDTIDNAINGKIDDVVTEVTERALPIIADQVKIQVSTTIDSHLSELRQKLNNVHNIDNGINTFTQRIEGDIATFRSTAESVTELQQQVTDIDTFQNDLVTDVRRIQFALRDKGIIKYPPDDDDDDDTTGNVEAKNSNDNDNSNNNSSAANINLTTGNVENQNSKDNDNSNNSSGGDINNNTHNNNDIDMDGHTTPRSLKDYASTITPASRAIQAHTTCQRFNSTTISASEDRTAEERIGHNNTNRLGRDNDSRVNNSSDSNHNYRSECSGPHDTNYMGQDSSNNRVGYNSNNNINRDGYSNSNNNYNNNSPNTCAENRFNQNNPYTRPNVDTSDTHYSTPSPRQPNLALTVREYQGTHEGMKTLTDEMLDYCGYTTNTYSVEDLYTVYSDIKAIHRHVAAGWYQHQGYHSHDNKEEGPQVQRIVAKNLSIFPKLHSTSMPAVIEFYDKLQRLSFKYLMPLVPFNHILLQHKSFGLCIPYLGYPQYQAAAAGLLELLPHLIPASLSKNFNANITSINSTSKNGYDVVWNILYQSVPGFDPSKSLPTPTWTINHDIFDFSEEFNTYFRVQRLLKQHQSDSTQSLMFLNAITSPEYIETVGILTTAVESKVFDNNNSPLPPHLQIHGLATIGLNSN